MKIDAKVVEKHFASEDEAVEYAIHCQRDRRNVSDAAITQWVLEVDKRKATGRKPANQECAQPCAQKNRSSETTAAIVGVKSRTVEKIRTIADKAPEKIEEIKSGAKSINKAYTETIQIKKEERQELQNEAAQEVPETRPEPEKHLATVARWKHADSRTRRQYTGRTPPYQKLHQVM